MNERCVVLASVEQTDGKRRGLIALYNIWTTGKIYLVTLARFERYNLTDLNTSAAGLTPQSGRGTFDFGCRCW